MSLPEEFLFKIVLLGPSEAGKTSLMKQYVHGRFSNKEKETLGVDFQMKVIDLEDHKESEALSELHSQETKVIRLQLWDVAGRELKRNLLRIYCREAHASACVFDMTNERSFKEVEKAIELAKQHVKPAKDSNQKPVHFLVGTKSDLKNRCDNITERAKTLAEKHGLTYIKTSAKNGDNVNLLFERMALQMVQASIAPENMKDVSEEEKEKEKRNVAPTPTPILPTANLLGLKALVLDSAHAALDELPRLYSEHSEKRATLSELYKNIINEIDAFTLEDAVDPTALTKLTNLIKQIPRNYSWSRILVGSLTAFVGLVLIIAAGLTLAASGGTSTLISAAAIKYGTHLMTGGIVCAAAGLAFTAGGSALAYSGRHTGVRKHGTEFLRAAKREIQPPSTMTEENKQINTI